MQVVLTPTLASYLVACERLAGYKRFGYRIEYSPSFAAESSGAEIGKQMHRRLQNAFTNPNADLSQDMSDIVQKIKSQGGHLIPEWEIAYQIPNSQYILLAKPDLIRLNGEQSVEIYDFKFLSDLSNSKKPRTWQQIFYMALSYQLWPHAERVIHWIWFDYEGVFLHQKQENVDKIRGESAYKRILHDLLPMVDQFFRKEHIEQTKMRKDRDLCMQCPYALYCGIGENPVETEGLESGTESLFIKRSYL